MTKQIVQSFPTGENPYTNILDGAIHYGEKIDDVYVEEIMKNIRDTYMNNGGSIDERNTVAHRLHFIKFANSDGLCSKTFCYSSSGYKQM